MEIEQILPVLIPSTFAGMLVLERLFPGRPLPKVRFWLLKGLLFFVFSGVLNTLFPALFAGWLGGRSLLHLAWLGTIPGAIAGALIADLLGYWLHRTFHKVPVLWRWTHQMHHSAERMDFSGMTYNHPFESIVSFALTTLVTLLLGLSPNAAALAGFLGFATAVIQHANIRTPGFLGYIIARPEQHGLHHERDVHAYNYASFPIWDIVFRTFKNPGHGVFPEHYGFWDGASARLGSMLIGRDVGQRRSLREDYAEADAATASGVSAYIDSISTLVLLVHDLALHLHRRRELAAVDRELRRDDRRTS